MVRMPARCSGRSSRSTKMRTVFIALIFVAVAFGQTGSFVVPSTAGILWGSHGDNTSQQNATGIPIPASVAQVWINNANGNSGVSVGCVTNGAVAPSLVACKTNSISTGSHIQVYNASTGAVVCSDTSAGVSTHTNVSVPIIAADGSIFIFDDQAATRINSSCAEAWTTSRTGALSVGGKATKPTPYGDYLLAEATNGMLALYNASTGSLAAGPVWVSCQTPSTTACTVGGGGTSSSYFVNTNDQACIAGVAEGGSVGATGTLMRCYYVGQNTALSQPNNLLFAVDVTSSAINITSWSAPFNGPSQATPDWTPGGNIVVDACSNGCTPVDVAIYAFADSWPTSGAGALATPWSVCASGCSLTATLPRYIDANMSYNPYGAILAAYFHSGQLDSRCVGTGLTSGCSAGWTMNLTGSLVGLTGGAASDVLS